MAEVESDEMLLPYFEYSLIPPQTPKEMSRKQQKKETNHDIELMFPEIMNVKNENHRKKMTMTFVKFQEDISMTGELFLHYNYPAN